jgi:uncharacterized Fe-S cluster protein YjdI
MPKETHKYSNGDITVVWKPSLCTHSKLCWSNLRSVFDPFVKPWINMEGGSSNDIRKQVQQCPSGALRIVDI